MTVHPRPAAVLFDLDGVLLDSEPLHFAALNRVLSREGVAVTEREFFQFLGQTNRTAWQHWVRRFSLPEPLDVYVRRWDEAVLEIAAESPISAAPGVVELLRLLAEHDIPAAVASSSSTLLVESKLERLQLTSFFRTIVGANDILRSKPDPEVFLLAASRLGTRAEHCLVIEDSPNGILAGRRAGMRVLAVRTPYTTDASLAAADIIVGSLGEVDLELLRAA